jgi:hypothetical protein
MSRKPLLFLALLALLLALAGCGGGSTGASATTGTQAADLVGADTVALVSINTDRDGDQWRQADELLGRFPGREKLLESFRKELRDEGVDWDEDVAPALGPELDLAVGYTAGADDPDVVLLVRPDDAAKLKELAAKDTGGERMVERELADGWWAISDTAASLDAVLAREGAAKLSAQDAFQQASADQAEESIVEAYVNGPRLRELAPAATRKQLDGLPFLDTLGGIVGSVQALDDGLRLRGSARGVDEQAAPAFESRFLDQVPAGAILFATFRGDSASEAIAQLRTSLGALTGQVEAQLGVRLDDLVQLIGGELAVYVRPGPLFPEVTLVATTQDEARATRTLTTLGDRLARLTGGTPRTVVEGGITFTQIPVQGLSVAYAVADGRIILTDLPSGAAKLGTGDSLADDEDFQEARDAAGMPDETTGFAYVNVADAATLLDLLGGDVPAEARENLRPLRSLLLYGSRDGERATVGGFLGIGQ